MKIKPINTNSTLQGMFKRAGIEDATARASWDELTNLYNSIAEAIVTPASQIAEITKLANEVGYPLSNDESSTIKAIVDDLTAFSSELRAIYNSHEGRTGPATDDNDLAVLTDVYMGYNGFFEKMNNVSFDNMLTMSEIHERIKQHGIIKAQQAAESNAETTEETK